MSWDAYLAVSVDGSTLGVGEWNYTHNCNPMIARVLKTVGYEMGPAAFWMPDDDSTAWWDCLNGLSAAEGDVVLATICDGLAEAPELFRSMNPENGWGDYDSLLRVMVEMRDRGRQFASGRWRVNG